MVYTSLHTWKESTRGFHIVSSHWKLQETSQVVFTSLHSCKLLVKFMDMYITTDFSQTCTMFSNHRYQFHNNYYLKVMEMTIGLKPTPFHISVGCLYLKMFDKRKFSLMNKIHEIQCIFSYTIVVIVHILILK